MTSVKRVRFRSYAGPSIKGTHPFTLEEPSSHWDRVLWLTSKVESGGKFGAITMYDGTAMTAGLHQAIAVYPKELRHEDFAASDDQGSLWKILRMLEMIPSFPELEELWDAFRDVGWYVSMDGHCRYLEDGIVKIKNRNKRVKAGDLVYGYEIREQFTPNQGKVPVRGGKWEQSKNWALAFHRVFSSPDSFKAQVKFGQEHFFRYCQRKKLKVGGVTKTAGEWLYPSGWENPQMNVPALDLALATFWSHSVNAPSKAWNLMKTSLRVRPLEESPEAFAKDILSRLGRAKYARWHFDQKNGRWVRTRLFARRSGCWPSEFFAPRGIMPARL